MVCTSFLWSAEGVVLSAEEKKAVSDKAEALQVAFDKGDADAIIAGTHPSIVKLMGSQEQFETFTRQSVKALSGKMTVISRTWGEPTPVYASGSEEVFFLPRISVIEMAGKRANSTGFFIVARTKGTTNWLFLDGSGLRKNPELLWRLFPGLPKDIVLPPNKVELIK